MSSSKLPSIITGIFSKSHQTVRNVLLICYWLLIVFISLFIWLRWISKPNPLPGTTPQPVIGGNITSDGQVRSSEDEDSATSRARDTTSGNGGRSRWLALPLLYSPWLRGQSRDKSAPPPAKLGIEILHDDRNATVDIVAVHGLGANPDYAWIWKPENNPFGRSGYPKEPFNWLKELLPKELLCRVMTFNYKSEWHKNAPQQRLSSISDTLLKSLQIERKEGEKDRPLIFIGHSFGGNIIEQAIVSATRHNSVYMPIAQSIAGVVFLGTPHRGSPVAIWGVLITLFSLPGCVTEDRILKDLEVDSGTLIDRLCDFSYWLFSESVPVLCCFEKIVTDYLPRIGFRKLVVPEESACIDGHERMALDKDHLKINKFYGLDDNDFKMVYSWIKAKAEKARDDNTLKRRRNPKPISMDESTTSGDLQKCLKAMRVANPRDILSDVQIQKGKRVGSSCKWILMQKDFSRWRASDGPQLLRIIGSPGIGKTMMSTFLVEVLNARVEKSPDKAFAYFFCDDKNQGRRTPAAILRSLMWQLLLQREDLFQYIQSDFKKHQDTHLFDDLFKNFSALWRIFQNMLHDEHAGEVFILIDALDECDKSTRKALLLGIKELFEAQPKSVGKFKFLVTYRPEISDIKYDLDGIGVPLTMDSGEVNADLSDYIEIKVEELAQKKHYRQDLKAQVEDALKKKAGGTFLWVSLMLNDLKSTPNYEVVDKLENLPKGLDETYSRILDTNIPVERRCEARFLLFSMVAARRPLKKMEIAASFALWKKNSVIQAPDLHDYMDICSLCSSIIYEGTLSNDGETTLNFCHQSVKDFLLDTSGESRAWYHTSLDKANLLMFRMCWRYLSSSEFDNGRLVIKPLGNFLREAELWGLYRQHCFLEYSSSEWKDHAIASYPALLRELNVDVVKAPTLRDAWLLQTAREGEGQKAVVELLLENGAELESKDSEYGQTPLSWAAGKGHEAVVKLLLEKGAKLESKDNQGWTSLLLAAEKGHEAVVKLLLEKGAELESKDSHCGQTPLPWAARKGHEVVVKLLLEKGAELEFKDSKYGQTPLLWAAKNGHEMVVKLLLEKGAELESKDNHGQTPLSWAAWNGNEAVVELLLEKGAELESKDSNCGQTPLSWAAEKGHEAVVKLLLEKGAELESKDNHGQTPLSWAAGKGHEAVVKLQLENGAELKSKDNYGRTPPSWAAENGREAVVKLLLEKGAKLESKDSEYGRTPLS